MNLILPQIWLFFFPFLFSPKKEGRRKGEIVAKIHAFQTGRIHNLTKAKANVSTP